MKAVYVSRLSGTKGFQPKILETTPAKTSRNMGNGSVPNSARVKFVGRAIKNINLATLQSSSICRSMQSGKCGVFGHGRLPPHTNIYRMFALKSFRLYTAQTNVSVKDLNSGAKYFSVSISSMGHISPSLRKATCISISEGFKVPQWHSSARLRT